jgi:hypothetical protein
MRPIAVSLLRPLEVGVAAPRPGQVAVLFQELGDLGDPPRPEAGPQADQERTTERLIDLVQVAAETPEQR